jgi:DNA-binding MarR family transcriptional regulator
MTEDLARCSRAVLETVPMVMRFIRSRMRRHRAGVTIPQFRSLVYVGRGEGASLGEVAEHLGLTAATTTRLVDGLEARRLVSRTRSRTDRRRITVRLTADGRRMMEAARRGTQKGLSEELSGLPREARESIMAAMTVLQRTFADADR